MNGMKGTRRDFLQDGYYLVVEEVRSPKTKRLALKSILRKKGNWKEKKAD